MTILWKENNGDSHGIKNTHHDCVLVSLITWCSTQWLGWWWWWWWWSQSTFLWFSDVWLNHQAFFCQRGTPNGWPFRNRAMEPPQIQMSSLCFPSTIELPGIFQPRWWFPVGMADLSRGPRPLVSHGGPFSTYSIRMSWVFTWISHDINGHLFTDRVYIYTPLWHFFHLLRVHAGSIQVRS